MMDYDLMRGGSGGGMMFFAWITYVIVNVALVYAIIALSKYINSGKK